jgi:transcriptional regulator with XRE-family HTH domain
MRSKGAGRDPEIGARIRAIRQDKRLTLKELASKAGCDQPNLSKIETGQTGCTTESLRRIATALNVAVSDLFESDIRGAVSWIPFKDDKGNNDKGRPKLAASRQVTEEAFAFEAQDDALKPLIHCGDVLICDPKRPNSMGRPVIAMHGDDLIVRLVRMIESAKFAGTRTIHDNEGPIEWLHIDEPAVYELYTLNNLFPPVKAQQGTRCFILGPVVQRITDMIRLPIDLGPNGPR